ncbi:hypothetical protein EJO68_10190 [Variovorax atrisoli]|uniref:hypothetical protein n=1 Tax=Variovorax atrisoli TaxID=3394203 RepID=UPI000F7ED8BE|nr:hypothetical protein [Variovorax sp. 369]RTD94167.1 hypothetical protein EJO68_10190 [Variovorax sp. 369]
MPNELVFDRAPLTGSPVELVFGDDAAAPSGAVYASGFIALPSFLLLGGAVAKRPPKNVASGRIPLPTFALSGSSRYDSAVFRPLVGRAATGWQVARQIEGGAAARHQSAQRAHVGRVSAWQTAAPASSSTATAWQDSSRARAAAAAMYQAALQLEAGTGIRHQEAVRARTAAAARWQAAQRLAPVPVSVRYQEAERLRREVRANWQEAQRLQARHADRFGAALQLDVGSVSRWQAAMYPLPGRSVIVPPVDEPCYEPSTHLIFRERPQYSAALVFSCERHVVPPGTVVVPVLEVYTVQNSISLVRLDSGEALEALAFSMSLDADSWTWRWSATLPGAAWPVIRRGIHVAPVDILATVNGVPYRLTATDCSRDRRFADNKVQVQGRGRAALLDSPYSQILNHAVADTRSVAQLLDLALTYNGVGIGWSVDFGLMDWTVPGGTWAFQGSHIGAVLDIASAAGAIVQPHATDATLRVLPRYPAAPWQWATLAPDFVLPAAAVAVEGIAQKTRPDYNRVFVAGTTGDGVLGQVTRAGTAGDSVADMVTHALMTDVVGVAQRGLPILSDTGAQADVTLSLQVRPDTGVIQPGALVQYEEGAETFLGLVRSVAVNWQRPVLRQSITLETHMEA